MKVVLMTTDCAQAGAMAAELIKHHRTRIEAVITSDAMRPERAGGTVRQGFASYRDSGARFATFCFLSFIAYFWWIRLDRLRSRLTGRPRRCRSVAELCADYGIPHLEAADVNGDEARALIAAADPDFIVTYWFDQILREEVIAMPRRAVVNFHPSLLPQARGIMPAIHCATKHGFRFGVTAHLIDDTQIDAGPILDQVEVIPPHGRSVLFYDAYVCLAGVPLVERVLDGFDEIQPVTPGEGTYYSFPTRADIAEARRQGYPLVTLRDFLAVTRHEGPAPDGRPQAPLLREA